MAYDVTVKRVELRTVFDLKGEQRAVEAWIGKLGPKFPEDPNTKSVAGSVELLWIGPEHWLLRAPLSEEASILERPVPDEVSVAHVSDTLASYVIAGPDANEIMAIACPLDLNAESFPDNGATYTEAFGLKALVCRCDGGYELSVERSFGDMLEDYLSRAIGP